MATWIGHPSPTSFPPGTTVHLYPKPATPWSEVGTPPGSETTSAVVSNEGVLTFTGLTEGSSYVGYVASPDRYLKLHVDTAAASGTVTSVNGKEGAVTLKAEDVEAVGTASPAFTGTPTAPTAAKGTSTTQLATTAFAKTTQTDAEAGAATKDATLKGEAESKDATTLSSAETAAASKDATAKTTTLNEAASKDATLKGEAETKDTAAREAAEAASQKRQGVHAAITEEVTLEADKLSPIDATSGALKAKLPTGLGAGRIIAVEKKDSSANAVTVEGNIRGEAAQSLSLKYAKEVFLLETDSSGSWWVIGRYIQLASIKAATRQILRRTIAIPAGQVPGNEVVLDEYVQIESGETRKIVWFEVHTTSGTIKVKVGRGEAGTTEISELNALEATEAIKLKTGLSISLSDKDRLRITLSSGSTPKGLFISWGEEVIAP